MQDQPSKSSIENAIALQKYGVGQPVRRKEDDYSILFTPEVGLEKERLELLDDRLVFVSESGQLLSKAEVLAPFRRPQGSMKLASAEEPENVRTAFADSLAVMSFTKAFRLTHEPTGAFFGATSRMTETIPATSPLSSWCGALETCR